MKAKQHSNPTERNAMTENIVHLWNEFQSAKLFAALRGKFDFNADSLAYDAYVLGKGKTLVMLTKARMKDAGDRNAEPIFKKGERKLAQQAYAKAAGSHSVKAEGPQHFVGIVGKEGAEDFKAEFSDERRSTVETPFGGEADNREVLS